MLFKIHGLVAQFISDPEVSAKWIARTPPKRQVEGSNPSGPVLQPFGHIVPPIDIAILGNSLFHLSKVKSPSIAS